MAKRGRGARRRAPRRKWLPAEDSTLREQWPQATAAVIGARLGRSTGSVYQRARELGLKKPADWYARVTRQRWAEGRHTGSRQHLFTKGHTPANKGLRRPGWAPGRMAETQFKKGTRYGAANQNWVPVGTEKVDPKRNVLVRKITDDPAIYPAARWRPVHTMVWESVHGPVPAGHIVVFRRGMKTFVAAEITIEKLELVSLAENMRRNTIHNYPPEVSEVMRLVGRLKREGRKGDVAEQH